jgi:hypothetical protein
VMENRQKSDEEDAESNASSSSQWELYLLDYQLNQQWR